MKVTISGSYRKFPEQLRRDFEQFRELGVTVLSPPSADLAGVFEEFAVLKGDAVQDIRSLPADAVPHAFRIIEDSHLEAIASSDLLWITGLGGYCGNSTALELGWALAHRVPAYALERNVSASREPMIRAYVNPVTSIGRALASPISTVPFSTADYWSKRILGYPAVAAGAVVVDVSGEKDVLDRHVLVVDDGDWNGRFTIVGGKISEGQDVHDAVRSKLLDKTGLSGTVGPVVYAANMIPGSGYRDPFASRLYVDFAVEVDGKARVPPNCEWMKLSHALSSDDVEPNARASLENYTRRA